MGNRKWPLPNCCQNVGSIALKNHSWWNWRVQRDLWLQFSIVLFMPPPPPSSFLAEEEERRKVLLLCLGLSHIDCLYKMASLNKTLKKKISLSMEGLLFQRSNTAEVQVIQTIDPTKSCHVRLSHMTLLLSSTVHWSICSLSNSWHSSQFVSVFFFFFCYWRSNSVIHSLMYFSGRGLHGIFNVTLVLWTDTGHKKNQCVISIAERVSPTLNPCFPLSLLFSHPVSWIVLALLLFCSHTCSCVKTHPHLSLWLPYDIGNICCFPCPRRRIHV